MPYKSGNYYYMKRTIFILLSFVFLSSCNNTIDTTYIASPNSIPAPSSLTVGEGYFEMPRDIMLVKSVDTFENATQLLRSYLGFFGFHDDVANHAQKPPTFIFELDETIVKEGYELDISEEEVTIRASNSAGAFYGVQTFRQLLPPFIEDSKNLLIEVVKIPVMKMKDAPAFPYRGMHLDVSRHFYPVPFIKEYISHLAALKMNTFHWHLTDDQGWRIEIKQYPDLTNKGAYREETLIGHYNDTPQQFDGKRYGGFYTQEEVKDIVAFAEQHHVTVIPEIELPGHAQAAIHAYPELGCTDKQVPVATKWGVFENIYCPKPETFTFLKNVLDEVIPLFPGEYIHIGGDEAPKTQWKSCAYCQKLVKEKGLIDEHGLQSYFITEIEKHLNSKGKKIIGWDEILEGGLAPNATVMSWRGTQGAVAAANQGHDVILTPTSHAYFDYYQATYEDEPIAIGGYLPLKKVYGFNPIPKELQGTEAAKHVLGAQGNVWTEYMPTTTQVEYMLFPRILAMSEVVWSGPTDNLEVDYPDFLARLETYLERLDTKQVNYANHLYDLEGAVVKEQGEVFYKLTTPTQGKEIKYSINGGETLTYNQPFKISEDAIIEAQVYKEDVAIGRAFTDAIQYHKAINASVSVNVAPHAAYSAGGIKALINGVSGSNTRFGDKEWLGFWGDDLEITINFDKPTKINKVSTRFYNANGQWVYAPTEIKFMGKLSSGEGNVSDEQKIVDTNQTLVTHVLDYSEFTRKPVVTEITLTIPSYGTIPNGLQGAGNKAWTFIDEIVVE